MGLLPNRKDSFVFIFYSFLLCTVLVFYSSIGVSEEIRIQESSGYSSLVINYHSGKVLYAKDKDEYRHPASLTKIMTLYLTFEALESGKVRMNQMLSVSKKAELQKPSKLGLRAGQRISVKDCIYALIVKSANDASVVLAEAIGSNEANFVRKMNIMAKKLGMSRTHFTNPHGWHDPEQITTASDIAKLSIALMKKYPKYYPLFSKTSFYFRGKIIKGHNNVILRYKGADGLKTGYVRASGFNLVTSVSRPEGRLIGIVFGGQTAKVRDDHMINILDASFSSFGKPKKGVKGNNNGSDSKGIFNVIDLLDKPKILEAKNEGSKKEIKLASSKIYKKQKDIKASSNSKKNKKKKDLRQRKDMESPKIINPKI